MKIVAGIVAALLSLGVLVFVAQYVAAESGEVVTVTTVDERGAPQATRIWVVDRDGVQWIRTGSPKSRWMARVKASPEVVIERAGQKHRYRAVSVPEERMAVSALMAEKYGWADRLIRVLIPGDDAQVMRLDPL